MNVRPGDMLRPPQSMQLSMNPPPHFQQQPPQQQQPPPNHVSGMPNNSMNLLTASPQSQNGVYANHDLQMRRQQQLQQQQRHYHHQQQQQQQQQQAQNVQMNTAAVASQANSHIPQHALQSIGFPGNMMPQAGNNLGQVRRVPSHPQALNQVNHVQAIHPGQPNMPGIPPMNPQNNMPSHLRQQPAQPMLSRIPGSIPGSMSPELSITLNRSQGQNQMRTQSSQPQLMNSLSQPTLPQAGTPTTMPPNGFPSHSHHPITSSSPRPTGPPQGHATNMIMGAPGPSQPPGARSINPGDGVFMGMQNPQFNSSFTPGGNRIPSTNPSFTSFVPSSTQGDMEMQQNMTDGISNAGNRPGFLTPAQQFEPTDNSFGANFNMPTQVNVPPRPPSHPTSGSHPSIPPRQPLPPHQHSPHQPDPMAGHAQPPPRPQSQPQGPSVRPPSQAGPSQTPRASHPQLPPSSSSGLLPPTRMPPITQAQTSPHQQRQATPGQQPIAPRPPQPSTSAATALPVTTASSSESTVPPPIRASPVVAMPVGLGQGLVRLLQFSGVLSTENPTKHQLSHWETVVKDYFTPKAIMKFTLWKDNQRNEAKPFEIGVPILPRFFLVTTQSGVKSMTLSLDGARERLLSQHHAVVECVTAVWTYRYTNGYTVTLRGPLTVHVLLIPHPNTAPSQTPPYSLKFDHLQFDANHHEKFIALDSVMGHRQSESPKTPRVRTAPTPSPNGTVMHRMDDERIWEEPRVMIDHASIPGEPVNAFGIPQATMRCLELAESVSQMTDLIAFANETKLGPMDALAKLADKLREGSQGGPYMGMPGHFLPFQTMNGLSTPPVTLYHSVSSSPSVSHPGPSAHSPKNLPPSADNSQKQTRPPTASGTAPPNSSNPANAPTPSQSGMTTPSMTSATLKRKPNDTNSPSQSNAEPSKKTRKLTQRR